ncbi:MAG TPA: molybdate ABC transporter permease subunit [Blastocatellia bacterium]|nr:molybdate ABC transporter permease subunit [Blastocatellia bacterium]
MAQAETDLKPGTVHRPHSRVERPRGVEWILIAIVIIYMGFLLLGPLLAIASGALSSGLVAMFKALTSREALSALSLTLLLATAATLINTVFGVCIALVLARDNFKGRRIINGLIDLPFAVSPVIAGFMLILLFGRNGWLTSVIDPLNIRVVFALPGMLMATIFVSLPFVVREVTPVLRHLSEDQENVAYTMGAGHWQTFWHITLPNIRWGLLYGVLLTFARAIGEFGAVLVVGGGVTLSTETSTLYIYRALDDRNEVGANTMALALAAISFTLLIVMEYSRKHSKED